MGKSEVQYFRLGHFIERIDRRNSEHLFGLDDIRGVSNTKELMPTKANMNGRDFSPFQILLPEEFVFNRRTTRNGERIGLGMNKDSRPYILTEDYVLFAIKKDAGLLPIYLYLFFCRDEFDRYVRYHSWGSATEFFNWEDMCEVMIPIPCIDGNPDTKRQQEIVDVWQGLRTMKEQNEQQAEPLFQLCRSYMERLKQDYDFVEIGQYIEPVDERNASNLRLNVYGINKTKSFMPTVADMEGVDIRKYKLVKQSDFAFSGMQTGRDECIRIALYAQNKMILVSPAYITFRIKEEKKDVLIPDYILLSFKRSEMDRYGWFISDSSVRANLDWSRFLAIKIPLPPIDVQRAIVNIYHCAEEAKRIAEEADRLSREICPALMQHIIHEADCGNHKDAGRLCY